MIHIIKKGKVNTYVAVCPFCGCKFTCQDFEDLKELNLNA